MDDYIYVNTAVDPDGISSENCGEISVAALKEFKDSCESPSNVDVFVTTKHTWEKIMQQCKPKLYKPDTPMMWPAFAGIPVEVYHFPHEARERAVRISKLEKRSVGLILTEDD